MDSRWIWLSLPSPIIMATNCKRELNEQSKILEKTILDWKGNLNQTDDILVMGIKI